MYPIVLDILRKGYFMIVVREGDSSIFLRAAKLLGLLPTRSLKADERKECE